MPRKLNLGKVTITAEGHHVLSKAYTKLSLVESGGSSYLSRRDVPSGVVLTNTEYWQLLSSRGLDGIDGSRGDDAYQPFKGWFVDVAALGSECPTPSVGDFAYVVGATQSDPVTVYQCTVSGSWAASQSQFNPSNNQEFMSGQALNTVRIINNFTTGGSGNVLSAEAGKDLKKDVESVTEKLTRFASSPIGDGTTEGVEQWLFFDGPIEKGDTLAIEWSCPTTGNTFAFESGDRNHEQVAGLYHVASSTETSGLWEMVAPGTIESIRVFSHDTGFNAKAYVLGSTNIIELLQDSIADVENRVNEKTGEIDENIAKINEMLVNSDTLIDDETETTEQWIFSRTNIKAGDKLIITWECPTVGNWYSIERGDEELVAIETLFGENPTTTTSGRIEFVAQTDIVTMRIFSHDAGFAIRLVKIGLNNAIDEIKSQIGVLIPRLTVNNTGLVSTTTGQIDSSTAWYGNNTTLPVKEGQIIVYTASPLAAGYGVAFFSNGTFISGSGVWFDLSEAETKQIVAPAGADQVVISWNRNWVPNQTVKFDNSIDTLRNKVNEINERIDEETSSAKYVKPHSGKKILSLGDSYTMMNYYGQWLAEITGCEQTPRGYNGQNIRHFADDTYQSSEDWAVNITQPLTSEIIKGFDIITIMGGTNDYGQGCAAGTISDSKEDNTVAGHLKWLIDKLYTFNPDARLYVCTQPYRVPHPAFHDGAGGHIVNAGGSTLEDCMDAVVAVCRYYGIPCFDFYHEGGWNEWTNRITNPENGEPSASNIYPPFNDNILSLDGLHPRSGEGHGAQMLGYMFGRFINQH